MTRGILVSFFVFFSLASPAPADESGAPKVLKDILRRLGTLRSPILQRTLIYGTTFSVPEGQPEYSALVQQFISATGATALAPGAIETLEPLARNGLRRGVVKISGQDAAEIAALAGVPKREQIAIVDVGENLTYPQPEDSEAFRQWLQARDLPLDFLDATAKSWDELHFSIAPETANTRPALYYYSHLFAREFALSHWAAKTAALKLVFPHAGISGRFGSTPFGEVTSHINAFETGALTMPRVVLGAEDFYQLDLVRAGIRGRETNLDSKIYAEIPFSSNENSLAWRKRFYGALAHGAKIFDIGDFRPLDTQAPLELRRTLGELSTFENIVQDGKLREAQTALLAGETGDVWHNSTGARRTLYHAARAGQLPLEVVTESDLQKSDFQHYKVLLLADRNISRRTAAAIVRWVENGGTLIATAGAGMRDELDQRNIFLFEQWGIHELEYSESGGASANPISTGSAQWGENTFPIFDARSRFDSGASEVHAIFPDGSPAVVSRSVGEGTVIYAGFRPHLQNEKAALAASRLMEFAFRRVSRPVVCSVAAREIASVESSVIQSASGIAIPLINKSDKPVKKLTVRLPFLAAFHSCVLASGSRVVTKRDETGLFAVLDLDAADALIFK